MAVQAQTIIVIPSRMASTRFPGKPLIDLGGKPMIQWVYEASVRAEVADKVIIATPDAEIIEAARRFGAETFRSVADHPSGTDRLAEVARSLQADTYLNIQGDEPLIDPENIRRCSSLLNDPSVDISSLYSTVDPETAQDPAIVKVVLSKLGDALYFSRSLVPYPRNSTDEPIRKHIGIYGFRHHALQRFSELPMSPLEATEGLEQLRFLENGFRLRMAPGVPGEQAIDTPEQANQVRAIIARRRLGVN